MRTLLAGSTLAALLLAAATTAAAQGAGTATLEVLQMHAGTRAGALAGAYTAVGGDADALFYNPAGIAGLSGAVGLSYQRHAMDVNVGSASGATRVGRFVIGAGIVYLDAGEEPVLVPDEAFGGERGVETGEMVGARESATRLSVGMPLMGGRLFVGAGLGLALSELGGESRSGALVDLGAQGALLPWLRGGLSLRNLGTLSGEGAEDASLPGEARAGVEAALAMPRGAHLRLVGDVVSRLGEGRTTFAVGGEGGMTGLIPGGGGAVLRAGFDADPTLEAASALHLGAGVSLGSLAVDYFYRNIEYLGAVHRIGVRWTRLHP
jgi:hypothetical protein